MRTIEATRLLDVQAALGEGPLWDHEQQVLWWVDILGQRVHRFDPAMNEDAAYDVGQMVGAVVRRTRGGLALAVAGGFATFNPGIGQFTIVADPEADRPHNRFNDGKCDPAGRFWAGTMSLAEKPRPRTGGLYSLDGEGNVTQHLSEVGVSNGIVWTSNGRTMYYIDTANRAIEAFDFDIDAGKLSNRRTVCEVSAAEGSPDGMAIDEDDNLWVALWGGWGILQIDPRTGTRLARVDVPAAQTTACAFGGGDFSKLYITTARDGISESDLASQPLAGDLFICEPGVRGVPSAMYVG